MGTGEDKSVIGVNLKKNPTFFLKRVNLIINPIVEFGKKKENLPKAPLIKRGGWSLWLQTF